MFKFTQFIAPTNIRSVTNNTGINLKIIYFIIFKPFVQSLNYIFIYIIIVYKPFHFFNSYNNCSDMLWIILNLFIISYKRPFFADYVFVSVRGGNVISITALRSQQVLCAFHPPLAHTCIYTV